MFSAYLFYTVLGVAAFALLAAITAALQNRRHRRTNEQLALTLRHTEADRSDSRRRYRDVEARATALADTLRREEERHQVLFNHARDMIFIHGVTAEGLPGINLEVNDVACGMLERSREELLKMSLLEIEDSARPSSMVRLFHRNELVLLSDAEIRYRQTTSDRQLMNQILGHTEVHYERVYMTASGQYIPVEVRAHHFKIDNEVFVMCTAYDITERQSTARAVREGQQRLRDLLVHSPIGSAIYDASCNLVDVNRACQHMFGTPDEEVFRRVNMFDNPFIPDDAKAKLARKDAVRFESVIDFDAVHRQGLFVSRHRGVVYLDILMINLGLDSDFKPKGYLFQVQDITQRREAEIELKKKEQQSRQSQKLEAIGSLASGIAHDFNNILTPVMGYAELVLHSISKDDVLHEYMTEVLQASHRAKDLINQILTFSRQSEQEGMRLRLSSVIKEVLKLVGATAPENVTLGHNLRAVDDTVYANPVQLHQVLMNLCVNGVHALKKGGGQITIRTDNLTVATGSAALSGLPAGRYLRVDVQDSGCGMDDATRDRIFEPFFSTRAPGEGTGMGLAVVHGIITGLKGAITVDSAPGAGTTFHVSLPIVEAVEETVTTSQRPVPTGTERIVVVDNEVGILRMMKHVLGGLGYTVETYENPEEALQLLSSKSDAFDLLISDQMMPQMTGGELAEKVLAACPGFPIIICTGFSDTLTPKKAAEMGIKAFIMKPIVMRNLAEAVRRALD